jgi:hypothetical protein
MNTDLRLEGHLFGNPDRRVYAILDGASIPGLLPRLEQTRPENVCLYRGELSPDLAECAPYLVHLEPEGEFTRWILGNGWGKHWGIFALTTADLAALRKHFRTFLIVKSPESKRLYFRYYDPRVLRTYLPTCNPAEAAQVFGVVDSFLCEGDVPDKLLCFTREAGEVKRDAVQLT